MCVFKFLLPDHALSNKESGSFLGSIFAMLSLFSGESGLNESLIITLIQDVDFGQMQQSIEHVLIGFHILIKNLNIRELYMCE